MNWLRSTSNPEDTCNINVCLKGDYGFFIFVSDVNDFYLSGGNPKYLKEYMKVAFNQGRTWLCLDSAAYQVEEMAVLNGRKVR